MSTETTIEELLEPFRNRTTVRGKNFQEKIENLKTRWEKVIYDCQNSEDNSDYRSGFCRAHSLYIHALAAATDNYRDFRPEIEPLQKKFLNTFISYRKNLKIDADFDQEFSEEQRPGYLDGLCYILVELEELLK